MNHVITYNKTLQERLEEYMDVLGGYETLPVSQITEEWAFFLEITIDNSGWQAIWKIPRLTCQELNIEFPTLALVYVRYVCFRELSAHVSVVLADEEIDFPKKHVVPLIQLWPTEKQDKSICLNLSKTANAIEMLRFFYLNLFMPWDDEDTSSNWLHKHLTLRLHLFYDLRNGIISEDMAAHIRGLLTEARHIQEHRECLLKRIKDEDINPDPTKQRLEEQKLLDIHIQLIKIKSEMTLLSDPSIRDFLISKENHQIKKKSQYSTSWIVFGQGKMADFITFLEKLHSDVGEIKVKFQSSFELALQHAVVNDTIYLCDGKHVFTSLDDLQDGGVIKGINSTSEVLLSSTNEDIVLDCRGNIVFENLYIDVGNAQCGILIRDGVVSLKNCVIAGDYKSSTQQGILVLAGAELHLDNCILKGVYNGIVANSGATLSLVNSTIHNTCSGLKCYDKSDVTVRSTTFKDCQKYGIFIETENRDMSKIGNFDILLGNEDIKVENATGENNGKANVKIHYKCQLEPLCDLFSNPELNPTIIHEGEEEDDDDDGMVHNDIEINESNSQLETTVVDMNISS